MAVLPYQCIIKYIMVFVTEAKDLLRQWRENNERRSEDVMELWAAVLNEDLTKLGNESEYSLKKILKREFC